MNIMGFLKKEDVDQLTNAEREELVLQLEDTLKLSEALTISAKKTLAIIEKSKKDNSKDTKVNKALGGAKPSNKKNFNKKQYIKQKESTNTEDINK